MYTIPVPWWYHHKILAEYVREFAYTNICFDYEKCIRQPHIRFMVRQCDKYDERVGPSSIEQLIKKTLNRCHKAIKLMIYNYLVVNMEN